MSSPCARSQSAPVRLRPLESDDLDDLAALAAGYALRTGGDCTLDQASLNHYCRSGHSFVASRGDWLEPEGFLLAHASWDGSRPVVRCSRLVAAGDDLQVLGRLLEAFVKSAYDAGVYDLAVDLPEGDGAGRQALAASGFAPRPVRRFERVLGSRGQVGK